MTNDHAIALEPALTAETVITKSVDVLLIGALADRQIEMIRRLKLRDLTVESVAAELGDELTPAILRSRIVLHLHEYPIGILPVARILRGVIVGVPIVCETSIFSPRVDWGNSGVVFADYDNLPEACQELIGSTAEQTVRVRTTLHFLRDLELDAPYHLMLQNMAMQRASRQILSTYFPADDDPFGINFHASLFGEAAVPPPESHNPVTPIQLRERNMMDYRLGRWFTIGMTLLFFYTFFRFK